MAGYCCERMASDANRTCDLHPDRFDCPDALIAEARGGFGLIVHDGGHSIIEIVHCPWCGALLPPIAEADEERGGRWLAD